MFPTNDGGKGPGNIIIRELLDAGILALLVFIGTLLMPASVDPAEIRFERYEYKIMDVMVDHVGWSTSIGYRVKE